MKKATVSIRELRINFAAVRKMVEEYGTVTVTGNKRPAYILEALPRNAPQTRKKGPNDTPMPDYYARLLKQQPKPLSAEESAALHEANRGDR